MTKSGPESKGKGTGESIRGGFLEETQFSFYDGST